MHTCQIFLFQISFVHTKYYWKNYIWIKPSSLSADDGPAFGEAADFAGEDFSGDFGGENGSFACPVAFGVLFGVLAGDFELAWESEIEKF